jgi:hypothetical protein
MDYLKAKCSRGQIKQQRKALSAKRNPTTVSHPSAPHRRAEENLNLVRASFHVIAMWHIRTAD